MSNPVDDDGPEVWLSVSDALTEVTEQLGEMIREGSDKRTRNLIILRNEYADYMKRLSPWRDNIEAGIPIWLKDGDFHLDRVRLHTKTYTRSYFMERSQGGSEIVYTSQHRGGAGYQWYILSWTVNSGYITLRMTHWLIMRDETLKRNTVYFTCGYQFSEMDEERLGDIYIERMTRAYENMSGVPNRHRRILTKAYTHSLKHDDLKDWVTVISAYGIYELMDKFNTVFMRLDMGEHQGRYLDKHFKIYWALRVLEAVWGKKSKWQTRQMDLDGILKKLWYHPDVTHFMDKERFDDIYDDWVKVRDEYEVWRDRFAFPPDGREHPPWKDDT